MNTHILRGYIDFLLVVVVVVLLAFSQMVEQKKENEDTSLAMGSIVATLTWPDGDTDVDLWIKGPGEKVAVGYSNKSGENVDLLRDDMGNISDILPLNYENAVFRSLREGEYTFNVHCYRCVVTPVRATLEIRINRKSGPPLVTTRVVDLIYEGQELTVIDFRLDGSFKIDHSSVNDVFQELRAEQ